MLLFIDTGNNGNTTMSLFQYISCYCLSICRFKRLLNWSISIHLMLLFICLPAIVGKVTSFISIHLMLLFIRMLYRLPSCLLDFNTSHVTVYLHGCLYFSSFCISIHLMLLFIPVPIHPLLHLPGISIHLMLLFINDICCLFTYTRKISIHLMLLFIHSRPL